MNVEHMSPHQQRIVLFMEKAGQDVPNFPIIPSADIRVLRAKLILEEAMETIRGLGVNVMHVNGFGQQAARNISHSGELEFNARSESDVDIVEVVDGCADISVVTIGTLVAFGIADRPIIEAVDAANLAKFGPGGHRRADGKWIKPPDWVAPDIAGLIKSMEKPD